MLLVLRLSAWPAQQGTNSGTGRIQFSVNILHSFAADSASVGSLHLRQITECAADLASDQAFRWAQMCSFAFLIRGCRPQPKSPHSSVSCGRIGGFTPLSSGMVCSEQPSSTFPDEDSEP